VQRLLGSVRLRITVVATLVFAVAFVGASVLLVRAVRGSMEDRVRSDTLDVANDVTQQLEAGALPEDVALAYRTRAVYIQIQDSSGRVITGLINEPIRVPLEPGIAGSTVSGESEGQVYVARGVDAPDGEFQVVATSPLEQVARNIDSLVGGLQLGIPLLIAAIALLMWWLVGRALQPVDAIRLEVEAISHGTLHRRVPVPASHDEVARLAGTMNAMLDRLESASTRQREFVSDASHELRSPIAAIKANLEVSLRHADDTDWSTVASDVLAEDERMERVVGALLELARLDEHAGAEVDDVDVDDVALDEASRVNGVTVSTEGVSAGRIRGRREQLALAVRNLLGNAVRHADSTVAIGVRRDGDAVELTVDDDGPGIAPDDREHVFERFTRLDEGRARDAGGAGLGLAIVRAVAERAGGTVTVDESPLGGARFALRLPAV
jgi:signal transduction histidine kinase